MHASGVNASLAVDMLTALSEKMYFGPVRKNSIPPIYFVKPTLP